jgi:shikimate dehydrogenase
VLDSSLQSIVALIGLPVAGEPSQFLFERAFAHHNLDWRFLTLSVTPEELTDAVSGMKSLGFVGGRLASPHEEEGAALLDRLDPIAKMAGAADAFRREEDELVGFHAGAKAVADLLTRQKPLKDARAIILGGGPLARALALIMASEQAAHISIVNSDCDVPLSFIESAEDAYPDAEFHIQYVDEPASEEESSEKSTPLCKIDDGEILPIEQVDFLINTLSEAAWDSIRKTDRPTSFDLTDLAGKLVFANLGLYDQAESDANKAQDVGCTVIRGFDVLVERAIVTFCAWTGFEPDPSVLRDAAEEFLGF